NHVRAGTFTPDGRFFFAGEGDLWEGGFEPGDDEGMTAALNGVRIAPLGFLNTDISNGGSLYVDTIMPAGKSIYVSLGGHHLGQLLRIAMDPKPPVDLDSGAYEPVKEHYARLARNLSTVKIIDDSDEPIRTCAAQALNGKERVFYGKGGSSLVLYLWDSTTGKIDEIATDEVQ
ncbi:MAG: hypothetical protein ABL994_25235, partial [Verrucomicrobiales bacterium]